MRVALLQKLMFAAKLGDEAMSNQLPDKLSSNGRVAHLSLYRMVLLMNRYVF